MMGPPTLQLPLYSGQWRVYVVIVVRKHHLVEQAYTLNKGTYDVMCALLQT